MKKFFRSILDSTSTDSSRRFITLIIAAHFILASFVILFIACYVIFWLPKGKVEPDLLALLKQVIEYDFYIILSGLGFITSDTLASILLERAKVRANIPTGAPVIPTPIPPPPPPPSVVETHDPGKIDSLPP